MCTGSGPGRPTETTRAHACTAVYIYAHTIRAMVGRSFVVVVAAAVVARQTHARLYISAPICVMRFECVWHLIAYIVRSATTTSPTPPPTTTRCPVHALYNHKHYTRTHARASRADIIYCPAETQYIVAIIATNASERGYMLSSVMIIVRHPVCVCV